MPKRKNVTMIPNALTAANLWLGVFAIINTIGGNFTLAAIYILVAAVLDGLDGKAARKLDATSEFGKQLDSLCDLVSFGVAPAILVYTLALEPFRIPAIVLTAVYITAGAFRLARFNILNVTTHFIGIPITIAGAILAVLVLFGSDLSPLIFGGVTLLLSVLMVSNLNTPKF